MNGRILALDDDQEVLDTLTLAFKSAGFHIDTAKTVEQARALLDNNFYHLLVVDITMDEADGSNVEGMEWLPELESRGLDKAFQVVIFSAHGTMPHMREAFSHFKVADFIDKHDFDEREFLARVDQILAERLQINFSLNMHWQRSDPEQSVANMNLDGTRLKRGTPLQARIALELPDLLARLFYDADSILIKPISPGYSGSRVLLVQPFFAKDGAGHSVVVKFGGVQGIETECRNFEEYVQRYIGGGRSTTIYRTRRTLKLGGIVYSFVGMTGQVESFGSFYDRAGIDQIKDTLNRLFLDTCRLWYANRGPLKPLNLTEHYETVLGLTTENLQRAISEGLKSVQSGHALHFDSLGSENPFTNPISTAANRHFVLSTYECKTHGDFNENNILVDAAGGTWLIDFGRTGPGHILRDIAELDSVVRTRLLGPNDATLEERLRMERSLCSGASYGAHRTSSEEFDTDNQTLKKAYCVAVHLRTIAGEIMSWNTADDISEYYVALMYYGLNVIRSYDLPTIQRQHGLLSASLYADRLKDS